MPSTLLRRAALIGAALAPLAQAQAAPCTAAGASPIVAGTVAEVAPGAVRSFSLDLGAAEGVIVDLAGLSSAAPAPAGDGDHDDGNRSPPQPTVRALKLCDATGALLAPQPGEVFAKGGSVTSTDDGERLRFVAPQSGKYIVTVASGDEPRELLIRRRVMGSTQAPVAAARLDSTVKGMVSSALPRVYSFAATAGQWVRLAATSEKDTLLKLAGPDRDGSWSVIAENDDSEGLNPAIRRKLPVTGTYYVQIDSLSNEAAGFELELARTTAPKPAPPPVALRLGSTVADKLRDGDDIRIYALAVTAGRSYRLTLDAAYDGVIAIGLPNPVEPDDGGDKPGSNFSDVKSKDDGTTGLERLNFTARSSGQLLVRVKSFGIGETDGSYTLTATSVGD
jgi:hypothetical protein